MKASALEVVLEAGEGWIAEDRKFLSAPEDSGFASAGSIQDAQTR